MADQASVTIHPASLMVALDKEADDWATETDLAATINRMSADQATQKVLMRFAKQCFAEGAYRGACNVKSGKALFDEPIRE